MLYEGNCEGCGNEFLYAANDIDHSDFTMRCHCGTWNMTCEACQAVTEALGMVTAKDACLYESMACSNHICLILPHIEEVLQ